MYNKTDWQNLPNQTTPVVANSLNKIENGIADSYNSIDVNAYDNTATYSVGDYCIYNNTLYRCIVAVTSAEDFDMSKWESTSLQDTMKQVDVMNVPTVNNFPDKTASNNTVTNVGTINIKANETYLLIATISFSNNSNGYRQVGLATSAGSANKDRHSIYRIPAVSGNETNIQLITTVKPTQDATYYINVLQNSGSSLSITSGLIVIKMK